MKNCREVEQLMAPYVDGEAAPPDRSDVDQHLQVCGQCRDDVTAQRAAREVVRARRHELCESAPPALHARCAAQARAASGAAVASGSGSRARLPLWQKLPLAAAATVVLAVAAVFGLGLNNKVQALALQMTLDHAACTRIKNAQTAAHAIETAQQWPARFGWPITVPPSSEPAGLTLRAVRRCAVTDGRVAHLIYEWRGVPLSVYVLPSRAIQGPAEVQRFGHESVMWSQNGRTYVVLASGPKRPELDGVVSYVKATVY